MEGTGIEIYSFTNGKGRTGLFEYLRWNNKIQLVAIVHLFDR